MANQSSKTDVVSFRIPRELYELIQRRMEKRPGKWLTVNDYVKRRFTYDLLRKH